MDPYLAVGKRFFHGLGIVLTHRIFWSCFTSWFAASFIKVILHFVKQKKFDFLLLVDTGRMPSSHSAFVAALATTIGMEAGWASPTFMVALGVAILTMNDAAGVRRAAGHQAAILNKMMDDIYQKHEFKPERLKEFLGHTRLEVLAGMCVGIICALLFYVGR